VIENTTKAFIMKTKTINRQKTQVQVSIWNIILFLANSLHQLKYYMSSENPILNNPYNEHLLHYATDLDGSLNYQDIHEGRRIFNPDIAAMPSRPGPILSLLFIQTLLLAF